MSDLREIFIVGTGREQTGVILHCGQVGSMVHTEKMIQPAMPKHDVIRQHGARKMVANYWQDAQHYLPDKQT